ncbi:MAG: 3-aminobutyryl-CoA ammonia lyase [Candidatus Rokubacteria bacterium]|nr:3-aminobutyryl-CoA ammonia lyase [Candidatus Rokubacteria bacterium]
MAGETASTTEVRHYRRVGAEECHYNGYLMSGAHILQFVSDAGGELLIRHDGEGGLLAAVEQASFHEPVYAGETLEILVRLVKVGHRSRRMDFEVYKHIRKRFDVNLGAAEVLDPPLLVAKGTTVGVVGKMPR